MAVKRGGIYLANNRRIQGEQLTRVTAVELAEIETWCQIVLGLN